MAEQKIYYKKVRDLSGIFSATFGFIKQNFKPVYGSLLFFAGPFLLVAAVISANMVGTSMGISKLFKGGDISSFYSEFLGSYFITITVVFIGLTIFNVILNKNLIENERLQADESLTLNSSITNFFEDFWRVLGNTLLLVVISAIFIVVLAFVFVGLFALAGGNGNNGGVIVMMVLFFLALMAFLLIFGPIISFVFISSLFVCQKDKIPVFAAIRKVLYYLKGNFWMTWVVIVVGFLTYAILAMVVQIPYFIVLIFTTFSRINISTGEGLGDQQASLLLVVVISICSLLSYGIRVIFNLMIIYQYNSLEEKKEGASIMDKINQIQ